MEAILPCTAPQLLIRVTFSTPTSIIIRYVDWQAEEVSECSPEIASISPKGASSLGDSYSADRAFYIQVVVPMLLPDQPDFPGVISYKPISGQLHRGRERRIRNSQGARPARHPLSGTLLVCWRGCGAERAIPRESLGAKSIQVRAVADRGICRRYCR